MFLPQLTSRTNSNMGLKNVYSPKLVTSSRLARIPNATAKHPKLKTSAIIMKNKLTMDIMLTVLIVFVSSANVDAAPVNSINKGSHESSNANQHEPYNSLIANKLSKKWYSNLEEQKDSNAPEMGAINIAPEVFTNAREMTPFLPDKWSNLFMSHQQRNFLPSTASFGSYSYGNPSSFYGIGMEKRRRGVEDQPQALENFVNFEPDRFEWNFNRL